MPKAYIGLGANLGQPAQQLSAALNALAQTPGLSLLAQSPFYRSAPLGPAGQPHYCNAACVVQSELAPGALLARMIEIEQAAGRVRDGTRWGPRLLDLDLLHVEGVSCKSTSLTLPHPEIGHRNFVLIPLADVAPELEIPGLGRVRELAQALGHAGLALWAA
jgi:2-amino-4-hydroxy-6-hydroxymethyldihydropteridine diphosphokinase